MNIYIPLYKLTLADKNRDNIKILISDCMVNAKYFNRYNEKFEYKFGKRTLEYVEEVYYGYLNNINLGIFILDIIYDYVYENLEIKKNNEAYKWFISFIDINNSIEYKEYMYIDRTEYDRLKFISQDYDNIHLKLNHKLNNEIQQYKNKIRELKEENQRINDNYNKEKSTHKELKEKFYITLGNMYFRDKKVLIICQSLEKVNSNELYLIEKSYGIKKIEIESSIKKTPNLKEKIQNSDIVILSVTQAKHDIDKLGSLNKQYYRTNRNNLNLIIKEVANTIGYKIYKGEL